MEMESRMLRESVADFRRRAIDERARRLDEEAASGVAEELFAKLAGMGLTASLLSEEAGGQGADLYSFCLALQEVARGSAGLAALLLSHNLALWAAERAGAGGAEKGLEWGGARYAAAWPATWEGGGARAAFVPGGAAAARIVFVGADGDVRVAEPGEGLAVEEIEWPLGWRASRPALAVLETARDPDGVLEDGVRELEAVALAGVSATALGISRHAYEQARSYASERWQGCDYIINHQQIRLMLAAMLAGIEAGEAALRQVLSPGEGGAIASPGLRAVKLQVCDHALQDATDAVQIHGGYGYMRDYGMELLMRDAKACQVYPRTPREELLSLLE